MQIVEVEWRAGAAVKDMGLNLRNEKDELVLASMIERIRRDSVSLVPEAVTLVRVVGSRKPELGGVKIKSLPDNLPKAEQNALRERMDAIVAATISEFSESRIGA